MVPPLAIAEGLQVTETEVTAVLGVGEDTRVLPPQPVKGAAMTHATTANRICTRKGLKCIDPRGGVNPMLPIRLNHREHVELQKDQTRRSWISLDVLYLLSNTLVHPPRGVMSSTHPAVRS